MVAPHRSASIDALRRNALTVWPGMTIFWIGDLAHQGTVSGHNPDDYPPLRAELTDSDLDPEVRALDFMIGSQFTTQDGWDLVNALVEGVDQQRLYYVIYRSTIWRRATGFQAESYGGDNHNDHVHVSGHVSDDDNGRDWTSVLALLEDPLTPDELLAALRDPRVAALMKALPWQYAGGGIPAGMSTLNVLNATHANAKTAAEKPVAVPAPVDIDALVAALKPVIQATVREELDKTKLGKL